MRCYEIIVFFAERLQLGDTSSLVGGVPVRGECDDQRADLRRRGAVGGGLGIKGACEKCPDLRGVEMIYGWGAEFPEGGPLG